MTPAAGVLKVCGANASLSEANSEHNVTRSNFKISIKTFIMQLLLIITIRSRAARSVSDTRVPQKLRANLPIQAA